VERPLIAFVLLVVSVVKELYVAYLASAYVVVLYNDIFGNCSKRTLSPFWDPAERPVNLLLDIETFPLTVISFNFLSIGI
jgi:hypothetical protein